PVPGGQGARRLVLHRRRGQRSARARDRPVLPGAGRGRRARAVAADERVSTEAVLREQAPRVLGVLVRRHGGFERCEDAVQEALLEAHLNWREVPEKPFGWLLTVAERRLIDGLRSDLARARREAQFEVPVSERGDTLALFLLCCHPD